MQHDMRLAFKSYDKLAPLKSLKANKFQHNTHPKEQIERLAKIMREHGVRHPIHISKRSGQVCFGHGRWEAAKFNGWEKFPIVYQEFKNAKEEFACVQSDNAIAGWAELDLDWVKNDLVDFKDLDIDLLGIKDFAISENSSGLTDEDEIPEVKESICKLGDIWTLGNHRLMCGDSTDVDEVDQLMDGEKADMVFTDPPYGMNLNVNYDEMFQGKNDSHKKTGKRFKVVEGDSEAFDPNPIFAVQADEYYIWGADYFYNKLPPGGSWIAWDKRDDALDAVPGNTTEFLWSKNPHRRMSLRVKWSGHHGMQREDVKTRIHPTQKPIQMVERFFEEFGSKHRSIVDLFGGSGSTLIACEKTNRKCFMMEIDPHYVDVIINRWQNYTGKQAEKINGQKKKTAKAKRS